MEALGWLAAGLTVWIDTRSNEQAPTREVVLRMLRQGEAAAQSLADLAKRLERERADHILTHDCVRRKVKSLDEVLDGGRDDA